MSIIAWLVVGLVAGWLAGLVVKGGGFGLIGDIIVGVIGAFIGGWLGGVLGFATQTSGINLPTIGTAFLGAVVLLAILKMIKRA
ncbi:GlsB/YeaQ/YmgE family stress response membrane protein [Suttonella sp. R2A3]|uniref:GlsB/YeaQ/YmgE family stress response membrane protein n=1 Tax=Suttonella sp. R2A3 TaxID=2908648 RepID=UPI001F1A0466|nr:GlsB/YeaQ/YmgE family stress response membrane protein [Suttonella sp. R2A3]UJF24251.1 GlsB/YeaQ/YmgE family stress response membrane protein [Suttonella sp. R2A3]